MPIVTLTTDFGTRDYYAGMLKGLMLSECENLTIIDISHHIEPFNITEAAYVLKNSWPAFPQRTVHVVSVNDADEREVRSIAVEYEKHYFVGYDNGIFAMIFAHEPDAVVELSQPLKNGSHNGLPGKNLFASAACLLANGSSIEQIGKPVSEIIKRTGLLPIVQESLIRGTVIHIDSFQNVIVNITKDLFGKVRHERSFSVTYRSRRNEEIEDINESYHDVVPGERLCRFNASGYLEIAINSGKASSLLGLKVGDYVQIDFK